MPEHVKAQCLKNSQLVPSAVPNGQSKIFGWQANKIQQDMANRSNHEALHL